MLIAKALLLLANGCVCPPCEARAPVAGGGEDGGEDGAAPQGGGAAAAPSGARHVLWDGEGAGEAAQGWADCDKKPGCQAALAPAPGEGLNASTGLKFHGEGPGWIGLGWNWVGWWPEDGGTDISQHESLTFALRVVAQSEESAPDLGALNISLRCSKDKKDSAAVPLKNYAPDVLDGEWHQVKIPLREFYQGKGEHFDPGTAWEFNLSTWSEAQKKFDLLIDDIAIEK